MSTEKSNNPKIKKEPRLKKEPCGNIANQLRLLRDSKKWKLNKLAEELQPYVEINLKGSVGGSLISNLENKKQNLTIELAIAYSNVFDVSLEYIFCLSYDMQPVNKEIKEVLGLSDISIANIKELVSGDNGEAYSAILNTLCQTGFMSELLKSCNDYLFLTITQKDSWHFSDYRWSDDDIVPMATMYLNNRIYNAVESVKDALITVGYENYEG